MPDKSKLRSARRFSVWFGKKFVYLKAPNACSRAKISWHRFRASIQVPHDPQTFQGQMRSNHADLRQFPSNQPRISPSRNDNDFFAWKLLRFDLPENLANQATVANHSAGSHCLDG